MPQNITKSQQVGSGTTFIDCFARIPVAGRNFQRGFQSYQYIRGQEIDPYGTSPHGLLDVSDIVAPDYLKGSPGLHNFLSQYKANSILWRKQGESLSQLVAQTAIDWLRENFQQRPFYLQVECFDPHEPWDPPQRFLGKRVQGFIQPPDVAATLVPMLGLKPPSRVTGSNLWGLVTGETKGDRDYVVQSYGWVAAVRDKGWSYTEIWKPEARQDQYHASPGAPLAPYKPQIYNLHGDPKELVDVADKYPDVVRRYSAKLQEYIASGEGKTGGSFNSKPSLDLQEGLYAK